MYTLEYISPWTSYIVDVYTSVMDCERDCERRFDVESVRFARVDGVLTVALSFEDDVILKLYEGDTSAS